MPRSFMVNSCFMVAVLAGCSQYSRYERPALFYPQSEASKKILSARRAKTVQIIGPTETIVPGASNTYKIKIIDSNCNMDKGEKPEVILYPDGIATIPQYMVDNALELAISIDDAADINVIEIAVKGCGSDSFVRESFKVRAKDEQAPGDGVEITGATLGIARNKGDYNVFVGDSDSCPTGMETLISVYPPNAEKAAAARASRRQGRWTPIIIDSNNLKEVKEVTIRAQSCEALDMTEEAAFESGLFRIRSIPVADSTYDTVSTKFNVWSQDDVADEFGVEFANMFIAADVVFVNRNDKSLLVYGTTVTAKIRFLTAREDVESIYGEELLDDPNAAFEIEVPGSEGEILADRLNFKEGYRPMSFSDVLAIFTYQKKSDPRQRSVDTLKSLGEVLTGATVFGVAEDFVKGVAFFTGIVNPELEKLLLWDVLLHAKNLESRSLKDVEEVPPHAELRRVVFFPRRAIYGILPDMPVYIAEIRPDDVSAQVTVINKEATLETGTAAQ